MQRKYKTLKQYNKKIQKENTLGKLKIKKLRKRF